MRGSVRVGPTGARLLLLLLAAFLVAACTTDSTDDYCDFVALDLTVAQAPAPSFSWTPANCGGYDLVVTQGRDILWLTSSQSSANRIHPPVRYGQHPLGGTGPAADQLTPGIRYTVIVHRANHARTAGLTDSLVFLYDP